MNKWISKITGCETVCARGTILYRYGEGIQLGARHQWFSCQLVYITMWIFFASENDANWKNFTLKARCRYLSWCEENTSVQSHFLVSSIFNVTVLMQNLEVFQISLGSLSLQLIILIRNLIYVIFGLHCLWTPVLTSLWLLWNLCSILFLWVAIYLLVQRIEVALWILNSRFHLFCYL